MTEIGEENTAKNMQQIQEEMVAIHAIFTDRARELDSSDGHHKKVIQIESQSVKRLSLRFQLDASEGYPTRRPNPSSFVQPVYLGYISREMQNDLDGLQVTLMEQANQIPEGDVMVYTLMQCADDSIAEGLFPTLANKEHSGQSGVEGGDDQKQGSRDRETSVKEEEEEDVIMAQKALNMKKLHKQLDMMDMEEREGRKIGKRSQKKQKQRELLQPEEEEEEEEAGKKLSEKEKYKKKQKKKKKKKKKQDAEEELILRPKRKSKWEHEIFERIKWDASIPQELVVIGYLDRFEGIKEIPFVDFKGVHEDLEGVPMHRIRYFKLNGTTVWDRDKRIDLLTGGSVSHILNAQPALASEGAAEVEVRWPETTTRNLSAELADINVGNRITSPKVMTIVTASFPKKQSISVYRYNRDQQNWMPALSPVRSATTHTTQFSILSFNVMCDLEELFITREDNELKRNRVILNLLESSSADIVALQEVTPGFYSQLLDAPWAQHFYHVSELNADMTPSKHGVVLLCKLPPSTIDVLWFSRSKYALLPQWKILTPAGKQNLNAAIVHLSSNMAKDFANKRKEQLFTIFDILEETAADHQFIVGDFNFGDQDITGEPALLNAWGRDSWIEMHGNVVDDPGITFDPHSNSAATHTSRSGIARRLDKIVYRSTQFSTKIIEVLRDLTVPHITDSNNIPLELCASDHYAVMCNLWIQDADVSKLTMKKVFTTTIAIVPPKERWPPIQQIRKQYDSSYTRWPPHINLIYPFFEEKHIDSVVGTIQECARKLEPFSLSLDHISSFPQGVVFAETSHPVPELIQLQRELSQTFPACKELSARKNGFRPHMTLGKFQRDQKGAVKKHVTEWQSQWQPVTFDIDQICVLVRETDTPFRIARVIPLGEPPILREHHVHPPLRSVFSRYDTLEDETALTSKKQAFKTLQRIVEENFGMEYGLNSFGSFSLGIRSSDIDCVCLHHVPNEPGHSRLQFFRTLQTILLQQYPYLVARCHVVEDALVPVLIIHLCDSNIRIDVLYAHIPEGLEMREEDLTKLDKLDLKSIDGILEANQIKRAVADMRSFQVLLSIVKQWAKKRGIYSSAFAFLGGISYAIMCARVVQEYEATEAYDGKHFDIDDHDSYNTGRVQVHLLEFFFATMANWNWNHPLQLTACPPLRQPPSQRQSHSRHMQILLSSYPHGNSARGITKSTFLVIEQELKRAARIVSKLGEKSLEHTVDELLQDNVEAFSSEQPLHIIVNIKAEDLQSLEQCAGIAESRIVQLCMMLENIHAQVRPFPRRFNETCNQIEIHVGVDLRNSSMVAVEEKCNSWKLQVSQMLDSQGSLDVSLRSK